MTAELVVVIAIRVCSESLLGSRPGFRPVRSHTTSTKIAITISTPIRVEPRYFSAVVTRAKPTSPASAASRQNTPTGAMYMTNLIMIRTTCWAWSSRSTTSRLPVLFT